MMAVGWQELFESALWCPLGLYFGTYSSEYPLGFLRPSSESFVLGWIQLWFHLAGPNRKPGVLTTCSESSHVSGNECDVDSRGRRKAPRRPKACMVVEQNRHSLSWKLKSKDQDESRRNGAFSLSLLPPPPQRSAAQHRHQRRRKGTNLPNISSSWWIHTWV